MSEKELYPCICCGNNTIGEPDRYEICSFCHWEDDPVQSNDPDFGGGANRLSLIEARSFIFKSRAKTS
ncbi:hypothetical protein IBT49_14275 [Erwinia sp. S63]|uniref:CPCC family cysteine-rich protein n=1 Tax=Erwinia sp. S63 TaxID=2769341 RepID=UPI00190A7D88|nr:CPCC family cysteine-rich protein [Erwinia sp. S63]MBK0097148.1 hypothetical protein [Erwinia sp. S63]